MQQGVALACPLPEHSSLRTPPSESEPKHQSNCCMGGEEQREGPTGPADPGGLGCREQMPGPVEGKPNWRTPSTSKGWSGFLSTLGNRKGSTMHKTNAFFYPSFVQFIQNICSYVQTAQKLPLIFSHYYYIHLRYCAICTKIVLYHK